MSCSWLSPWVSFFPDHLLLPSNTHSQGWCAEGLNRLAQVCALKIGVEFEYVTQHLPAMLYEQKVYAGTVPTRDVLHDWYNGLVWLLFPNTKRQISIQHVDANIDLNSGNGRNSVRNVLTLFDESGALLLTSQQEFMHALSHHDWHAVFVKYRAYWHSDVQLNVFGHGLLEALHQPYKGLCAKVWMLCLPKNHLVFRTKQSELYGVLDTCLAEQIVLMRHPKQLQPLPVMGVPGWFEQNEQLDFYLDRSVFRPKPT